MNRDELRKELFCKLNTTHQPYFYGNDDCSISNYNFQIIEFEKLMIFAPLLLSEDEKAEAWGLIFKEYNSPREAFIKVLGRSFDAEYK